MVFENVQGMLAPRFSEFHDQLLGGLKRVRGHELTTDMLRAYVLNAADYGVAQERERLVFPVMRKGEAMPPPPPPTVKKWITLRDAIGPGFMDPDPRKAELSPREKRYIKFIRPGENMRDALKRDHLLRELIEERGWSARANFYRVSSWGDCSKTIIGKMGPSIVRLESLHPDKRRFTIGERRELQGFPQAWVLLGNIETVHMLVGNAVPAPMFAAAIRWYFGRFCPCFRKTKCKKRRARRLTAS